MVSVRIIIVTFNGADLIGDCLDSLNKQSYKDFEVVIVDNLSTDGTRGIVEDFVKKASYDIKMICSDKNLGFAGANNLGAEDFSGSYIALLNQDVKAHKDWLNGVVRAMDSNADVGICASKILTWNGESIDSAGEVMFTTLRSFKRKARSSTDYSSPEFVFAAPATAALYRVSMLEKIEFFDEDFFIQCEDTDLSLRAQLAGWKILYVPESLVYHMVSYSVGVASDISVYYTHRNIEFVRIKNIPAPVLLLFLPMILLGTFVDFMYFGIRSGKWRLFLKAKFDAVRLLPHYFSKRRHMQNELRTIDAIDVIKLLTPVRMMPGFIATKLKNFLYSSSGSF